MQRSFRAFIKNGKERKDHSVLKEHKDHSVLKERKDHSVLLKRTDAQP